MVGGQREIFPLWEEQLDIEGQSGVFCECSLRINLTTTHSGFAKTGQGKAAVLPPPGPSVTTPSFLLMSYATAEVTLQDINKTFLKRQEKGNK